MNWKTALAFTILFAAGATAAPAQESRPAFGISLSGFVKTDIHYDTRRTESIREGNFLLFPLGPRPDPAGNDIIAAPSFNILSIQTRLTGEISGPDALGAETSALFEGEFFGHSDPDINGFRLRHAYLTLSWPGLELLVGQYWHPLYVIDTAPDVISFNAGAPFQAFNRSPQVRLSASPGRLGLVATAVSQRDFQSPGPQGDSTIYARNAVLPELGLQGRYSWGDPEDGAGTLAGAAFDYLVLQPREVTPVGFKTSETVGSRTWMAFFKHRRPGWTGKLQASFGQNSYHLTMLGGYAVRALIDPVLREADYTPSDTFAAWGEVQTNGRPWRAGLFAGWTRNLGTSETAAGPRYVRGEDIDTVYRLSPRLVLETGPTLFAVEIEYTAASYGTPGADGRVRGADFVGNLRLLVAAQYNY